MDPADPKFKEVTLKTRRDGSIITQNLLKDYCSITLKEVALTTARYIIFGSFIDDNETTQTLGYYVNLSSLHFK